MGGAVAAAEELPDPLGAELLDVAREAFTQALQLTAITSAAIVVGVAILAAVVLRDVQTDSGPEGQPEPSGAIAGGKVPGPSAPGEWCDQEESPDSVSEEPAG